MESIEPLISDLTCFPTLPKVVRRNTKSNIDYYTTTFDINESNKNVVMSCSVIEQDEDANLSTNVPKKKKVDYVLSTPS